MSKSRKSKARNLGTVAGQAAVARAADREARKADDPWFGRRRSAGEMGRNRSKAGRSKAACRGRVTIHA